MSLNTSLLSVKNGMEGGSGLDVSTSVQCSLQMQYQQSMQLEEEHSRSLEASPHSNAAGKDAGGALAALEWSWSKWQVPV